MPIRATDSNPTAVGRVATPQPVAVMPAPAPGSAGVPHAIDPLLPPASPIASCLAECRPGNDNCVIGAAPPLYAVALARLANAVMREQTIEPPALLQSFQQLADPCRRGPTLIHGASLTNSGGLCVLTAPFPVAGAIVRIELLPNLAAAVERRAPNAVLRFNAMDASPSVRLLAADGGRPHPLEPRFAGRILQVEMDQARAFLRTPGGCIGVTFGAAR